MSPHRRIVAPLNRRAFLRAAALASAGGAAALALGCGSDGGSDPSPTSAGMPTPAGTAAASGITPYLLTNEFVVNQDNRFAIGLLNPDQKLLREALVHARFFTIGSDGQTGTFRGEGDMQFVDLTVDDAHAHDGTPGESDDSTAFYLLNTPFDQPGRWGAEIAYTPAEGDGDPGTLQLAFDVLETSKSPGLSTTPPASQNDTAATNPNAESLCSRDPACDLHDLVIADVLGQGRPLVVQFSTPAFCETRFCGPVLEVLLSEVPNYRDRIDFVHIEVWQDFQLRQYRPAVQEWSLPTEPYTFFITSQGTVAGKFEAIFSEEELRSALDQLVAL